MGDGGHGEQPEPAARLGEVAADVVPEHVAAALAQLDAALEVLHELRWAPLAAGEVRAVLRELTARQAVLASTALRGLTAVDARDDVVPRALVGRASVAFQQHALGLDPTQAHRDSTTARLLDADGGDLRCMGAAFAEGRVRRGHVDAAMRIHRELGARLRDELIPLDDGNDAEQRFGRRIEALDALLTEYCLHHSVPETERFVRLLAQELNPKTPAGAHEHRFLRLSRDLNGNWIGKLALGEAQGALLNAAINAGNAPRPGMAIDENGVKRELPDPRDQGQRDADALMALVALGADRAGIHVPEGASRRPDPEPWPDRFGERPTTGATDEAARERAHQEPDGQPDEEPEAADSFEEPDGAAEEPPEAEGEYRVLREPGVLSGPYPPVKILVTVSVEQLAAVLARAAHPPDPLITGVRSRVGETPPPLSEVVKRLRGQPWMQHAGHPSDRLLVEMLAGARLHRVLQTSDGAVLSMGRSVRLATTSQKDSLVARDLGCCIPGCGVPGEHCEVHHVVPWAAGGPTDVDNLVLACSRHHAEIGQGTWEVTMRNGIPWVRVPGWVDHTRPLLRNHTHHRPPDDRPPLF